MHSLYEGGACKAVVVVVVVVVAACCCCCCCCVSPTMKLVVAQHNQKVRDRFSFNFSSSPLLLFSSSPLLFHFSPSSPSSCFSLLSSSYPFNFFLLLLTQLFVLKYAVPGLLYAICNVLNYVVVSMVGSTNYQLLNNMKIVTTGKRNIIFFKKS